MFCLPHCEFLILHCVLSAKWRITYFIFTKNEILVSIYIFKDDTKKTNVITLLAGPVLLLISILARLFDIKWLSRAVCASQSLYGT